MTGDEATARCRLAEAEAGCEAHRWTLLAIQLHEGTAATLYDEASRMDVAKAADAIALGYDLLAHAHSAARFLPQAFADPKDN